MGLDQYAYSAMKAEQRSDYYNSAEWDPSGKEYVSTTVVKPREIAYWRKHPNLHGWMEQLYRQRGGEEEFNGVELELTWQDLERLEQDLTNGNVADLNTRGFFFGDASDDYYRERDLAFIAAARAELFLKFRIFYNSSW